jgi:hypothetical protein
MKSFLMLIVLPALCWAQEFQFVQELDSIPVVVNGDTLPAAWIGGYARTAPELADLDDDDDFDLLLGGGGYGVMSYWKNVGSSQQEYFHLEAQGLSSIDTISGARPEFWDMDADGDLDLILASYFEPFITIYENIGTPTSPFFQLHTDTLRDIDGNLIYCQKATLGDLDADGDMDLLCGEYGGYLYYYQNVGNASQYAFTHIGGNFSGIDVGTAATPELCDLDADGDLDLVIGERYGNIWYYQNFGTSQLYNFNLISDLWLEADVGDYALPEFCDIDGDGDYDLFIGKDNDTQPLPPGEVHFWRNLGTPQIAQFAQESEMYLTLDFGRDASVGVLDVNLDGRMDLFVYSFNLRWLKNIGSLSVPCYQLQNNIVIGPGLGTYSSLYYGQLNGDRHMDIVRGWSSDIQFWINSGDTSNPQFYLDSSFSVQWPGSPFLADMDGDGDNDLIVAVSTYHWVDFIYYYENQGTMQNYNFVLITTNYQGWAGEYYIDAILDADSDGDNDIFAYLNTTDSLQYLENIGTPQQGIFASPITVLIPGNLNSYGVTFCDVDNDGDLDAFNDSYGGGIYFFRNITGESPVPPDPKRPAPIERQISLLPNPGNSGTTISYVLSHPQHVNLSVYNLLGSRLVTLVDGLQQPGNHVTSWDAKGKAAGVYLMRLEAGGIVAVKKVVVVK